MKDALCYCGNVHAARDLDELLRSLADGPAKVRVCLDQERLSYGLWMSEQALAESRAEDHTRLKEALATHKLDVWTMNAFPQGNFHADVVKYDVYRPHWADPGRARYTLQCAELLTELLAEGCPGTISTLPIGYRKDFEDASVIEAACAQLCETARGLQDLATASGKPIRLCLEPEPGCVLETGADLVEFWRGPLTRAAEALGLGQAVAEHLGMCLDTCHHAVAFEDPEALLLALEEAAIPIAKVQLSSAVQLQASDPGAFAAMQALSEKRFLHQVRARYGPGPISGCDDLSESGTLLAEGSWRVHFHVPIHRKQLGVLETTQEFLNTIVKLLPDGHRPHFEVETYTWNVLPLEERPGGPGPLAESIAKEMRYATELLS